MKTKNVCIALAGLLLAACSTETELGGDPSQLPEDATRREVTLAMQNNLVLKGASTKAGEPIATAPENLIETMDVYVFGSLTEHGTYTFQERFSYRADATPVEGALSLNLTTTDKSTTGVLRIKKGLFSKFYCVANHPNLFKRTGSDFAPYANFRSLAQSAPGTPANTVTAGIPSEADFLTLNTTLLNPTEEKDTLVSPLPMSGAYTPAMDLTDINVSSHMSANVQLSRLVARFDIVNDSTVSKFTLKSVSMGRGQAGVFPFDISPLFASADSLITYPNRKFYGTRANIGAQGGAFYAYPSPKADEAYLLLTGDYWLNKTTKQEATYKVFFKQVVNGNGGFIEITPNHRYTVEITEADPFEVKVNITVADWIEGGNIDDYLPDNAIDEIRFEDASAKNIYYPTSRTVGMATETDNTFTLKSASNSALTASVLFPKDAAPWFELLPTNANIVRSGTVPSEFVFKFIAGSTAFAKGAIHIKNPASGLDSIVYVLPITSPTVEITPGADNGINTFKDGVMNFYQTANSKLTVTVKSAGGSELENVPAWLTPTKIKIDDVSDYYTFTVAPDAAIAEGVSFTIKNLFDVSKTINITTNITPSYQGFPAVKVGGVWWAPFDLGETKIPDPNTQSKSGFYQWGRNCASYYGVTGNEYNGPLPTSAAEGNTEPWKDKFILSKYTGILEWIPAPMPYDLWNSGTEESPIKTQYDPCPNGWRVPTVAEANLLLGGPFKILPGSYPVLIIPGDIPQTSLILSSSGFRGCDEFGGWFDNLGRTVEYWTAANKMWNGHFPESACALHCMLFDEQGLLPEARVSIIPNHRGHAYAIRCVKE